MSGGKGGSSTSEVTIPEYIEAAAQRNLNKAERISQIGYTPYYGPDVAAFTPMQQAAFQNTADTAGAFGMAAPTSQQDIMGGMAAPTTYANGVQGYSSAPMYEESLAELGRQRPGQKAYIDSFFIDPVTGGAGSNSFAPIDYTQYGTMAQDARNQSNANRANDLAIARASASSSADFTGGNPLLANYDLGNYNPTSTDPYGNYTTDFTGGNSALSEYNLGGYAPTSTDPYGDYSGDSGDYSGSGGYTSIGDMFDGGGAGTAGPTYSGGGAVSDLGNSVTSSVDLPGNVISRALNVGAGKKDSSSDSGYSGSSGDGTVMCTAYCEMGYLPREIWKLDRR